MKTISLIKTLSFAVIVVAPSVMAQNAFVYPAQGQSQQQMEQDKYQCYAWAKNNSGFDPMQAAAPVATAQQPQRRGLLGGAARGAAVGAVGGAIGGDAGKGAAIGAATGAMVRGFGNRDRSRQQQQANAQAQQQNTNVRNGYDRAYAACLEGKGYSVK
jgi:hypothetical protein